MVDLDKPNTDLVLRQIVREYIKIKPADLDKTQFTAAIQSMSNYFDDNAVTINNALPADFKSKASTPLKAALLAFVVLRKYGG